MIREKVSSELLLQDGAPSTRMSNVVRRTAGFRTLEYFGLRSTSSAKKKGEIKQHHPILK